MRVLHVISSGGMYGAEAIILNLSRSLLDAGHASALGVFSNSAQPNLQLHESALAHGIESHLVACQGQLDLSVPASIRSLVQQTGADLVHAHGYKADIYTWLALRSRRTPLVSTCHTWYDNDLFVRTYGALDRLVLRSFSGVVAVSEEVRQRLLHSGVRARKVHLIRNGIDLRPFATERGGDPSASPLTVGLVGRLSREKGIDLFLRAAAIVLTHLPQTQFVVAGDGPDRESLQHLIAELDIASNARLLGRREDMPALLVSLDLVVSASRQEGLPVALLEAMASALPLVATDVGAVPTVVQDGITGRLVPPDNVDALAAAMLDLLRSPGLRQSYGAAGRDLIAREFSAERMTSDYLSLYQDVLAGVPTT